MLTPLIPHVLLAALSGQVTPGPPPSPIVPGYGDRGTSEITGGVGLSAGGGISVAAGYRHFFVDRIAPGIEASYLRSDGYGQGSLFGTVRVVILRFDWFAVSLLGRGGRMFVSDIPDGWAAGGGGSLLVMATPNVGFEVGYEALALFPSEFCERFDDCVLNRPFVALRFVF